MAKRDYRTYAKAYRRIVKNEIPVTGIKYDENVSEIVKNEEDFRQCYDKNDKVRSELPRFWFISKEGFLINVKNKDKPKWVKPDLMPNRPAFNLGSRNNKKITTYALVGLVWGSYRSESAQAILNRRGVEGLGSFLIRDGQHVEKVQGHHTNGGYRDEKTLESYIANNDPANVQLVSVKEHDILNKLRDGKNDIWMLYQPKFENIQDGAIQVYNATEQKMMDENVIKIKAFKGCGFLPAVKDSIVTDKYVFICENCRKFLEPHIDILSKTADEALDKYDGTGKYYIDMSICGELHRVEVYKK